MSWSIEITGTKEGVAKKAAEQLDKIAASYAGKEEGKDVLAVKERVLALVAACDLVSDSYTTWNAVNVKANGSHSQTPTGILGGSFQVAVTRASLAL